jgi:hypothetical protein
MLVSRQAQGSHANSPWDRLLGPPRSSLVVLFGGFPVVLESVVLKQLVPGRQGSLEARLATAAQVILHQARSERTPFTDQTLLIKKNAEPNSYPFRHREHSLNNLPALLFGLNVP